MRFAVYNLIGNRIGDLTGKARHHFVAGGLDTVTIDATECDVVKGYRLMYCDDRNKWHEFIVSSVALTHDENGVNYEIYAENSLVSLRGGEPIGDRRGIKDGTTAIAIITAGSEWQGRSEQLHEGHTNYYRESPYSALSKTLKAFRCELKTDIIVEGTNITRIVTLTNQAGADNGKRFSYRKDMTDVKRTVKEDDIITRLYPYGKGEESGNGYGRRITIADVNGGVEYLDDSNAQKKYGYNGKPLCGVKIYDDIDDKSELKRIAESDLKSLSQPTVEYAASVIDLKSYGYDFEGVAIGDTVRIRDKDIDLAVVGRVVELEIDLDGIEETVIKLGNIRPALGKDVDSIRHTLDNVTAKQGMLDGLANHDNFIEQIVRGLNDAFSASTSYIDFNPQTGLTFTDNPNKTAARWALNLGSMGFRIANRRKANGEWDWRTFGTGDGFVADLIRSGTLQAGLINAGVLSDKLAKNLWDLDNSIFSLGNGAIRYSPDEGLKIQLIDDLKQDVDKKADANNIITTINASREGVAIAGKKVQITGETHIDNGVIDTARIANGAITTAKIWELSADKIRGGTIDADNINVRNLNADNLTKGTVSRGVSNGSCTLPMSGSASLAGYGTNFNTASSAFVFDYSTSTFEVQGSIAANRLGTRNSLEHNGLTIVSDGGRVSLKPCNDFVRLEGSAEIRIPGAFRVMGRVNFDSRMDVESDVYAEALHVKNPKTGNYINVAEWLTT